MAAREELLEEDDKTVPPPIIISPCWAEANWAKNRNAQMGAKIANFLKRNLLISSLQPIKMRPGIR